MLLSACVCAETACAGAHGVADASTGIASPVTSTRMSSHAKRRIRLIIFTYIDWPAKKSIPRPTHTPLTKNFRATSPHHELHHRWNATAVGSLPPPMTTNHRAGCRFVLSRLLLPVHMSLECDSGDESYSPAAGPAGLAPVRAPSCGSPPAQPFYQPSRDQRLRLGMARHGEQRVTVGDLDEGSLAPGNVSSSLDGVIVGSQDALRVADPAI